ncbi:LysR family transcriptional regulator [Streptococcus sp. H49]|uniref:LysR family transcriptional regulator n=1 Tax=Streptococcus huangxiaojuni TaxID=3237239 RepID=UPI0034A0DE47
MIEDYLLEALVAFAKYGTLSATAEQLLVTQPTVTRGMQKLEEELDVQLFDRQPNRISLTETGKLAAKEAADLLQAKQDFIRRIQQFDRYLGKIRLGTVAPGPLYVLETVKAENLIVENSLISENQVADALDRHQYQLIFTSQELETASIESLYIGTETLSVMGDAMTIPANKKSTTFAEMTGFSFVVFRDIGIWQKIIEEHIPKAKFLYQSEMDDFNEIRRYSSLPFFTTNLAQTSKEELLRSRRLKLPITDEAAKVDFYLAYRKDAKSHLQDSISSIQKAWADWIKHKQ